jgi:hypothetical protein
VGAGKLLSESVDAGSSQIMVAYPIEDVGSVVHLSLKVVASAFAHCTEMFSLYATDCCSFPAPGEAGKAKAEKQMRNVASSL